MSRRAVAVAAVAAVLVALTLARRGPLAGWADIPVSAASGVVAVVLARWAGVGWAELGLSRANAARGLRFGAAVFGLVVAGCAVVALVPATRTLLEDERARIGFADLLGQVLVATPFGVVLLEELAFRSVLPGLLATGRRVVVAHGAAALAFGFWHVAPTLRTAEGNAATASFASSTGGLALTTAGMVVAMTGAGAALAWLRVRSASVAAPLLTHLATNTVTLTAAWTVQR